MSPSCVARMRSWDGTPPKFNLADGGGVSKRIPALRYRYVVCQLPGLPVVLFGPLLFNDDDYVYRQPFACVLVWYPV